MASTNKQFKSLSLGLIGLLSAFSLRLSAQSFSDLFGQASKQKQYYLQQLAAYEMFRSDLKQGYGVMKHGLNGIRDINAAELSAHTVYYQSLKQPGSAVKNSSQVQDILQWQQQIATSFNQNFRGLTADEQNYISAVQHSLLKACNDDLLNLQSVLGAGLQMTDDQRLQRLDHIHAAMQDKYRFSQSFCNSVRLLAAQRQQEINESQTLKTLYETN